MKWSLEQLQRICDELKDEKEIDIMKKCGENSENYTLLLIMFHIVNVTTIASFPFVLYIFDVVMRVNKYSLSYVLQMLIPKHFLGRENYIYLIVLHTGAGVMIGGFVFVATMAMCVAYVKHTCGMFRIASYRIEKAVAVNTLKNITLEKEIIMYRTIIQAVDIHRKAINSTILFFSGLQQSRFILIIIGVISLSLNLYEVSILLTLLLTLYFWMRP